MKKGVDKFAAELLPPSVAQERIRAGAARALGRVADFAPLTQDPPYVLGVEWNSTAIAAACALIPGVREAGERHVEFVTDDFAQIMGLFGVFAMIGGQVSCGSGRYG